MQAIGKNLCKPKTVVTDKHEETEEGGRDFYSPVQEEEKIPLTEKIKTMLSKMFEVEDQPIK